jgi:hypothetical protein
VIVAKMSGKSAEITDAAELLRRIDYRNKRILTRIDRHEDAATFAKNLASRTKSDLRRLAELLNVELDEA